MRPRFSRRAAAVVIKITQIAYDRIKQISIGKTEGGRMVHSALLRVFLNLEISLSTVGTEGRDCESPNPPAGVPKPSKYGGRSEKKKRGALSSRTATPTGKLHC